MRNEKLEKKLNKITKYLGDSEIKLQLAEECGELIQAILKYRRSILGLTPVSQQECENNIIEELADVLLNIEQVLSLNEDYKNEIDKVQNFKINRRYKRIFGEVIK